MAADNYSVSELKKMVPKQTEPKGKGFGAWLRRIWNSPVVRGITGDAISFSIDIDVFVFGGIDIEPIGVLMTLRGKDAFKPYLYTDVGFGAGLDLSVSIEGGRFWYTGNPEDVLISMFQGPRIEANLAFTALIDIGVGGSVAQTINGHYIIGVTGSFGLGMPAPLPITGNINAGWTEIHGDGNN